MLAKAFLICIGVVLMLLGPRVFQHYRHKWGYDDSTVVHQSTTGQSFSVPQELPTTPQ